VPQLGNARRFATDLAPYPRVLAVEAACLALPAFRAAAPEAQPDAE
jgi:glutathione S-transferase